MAKDRLRIVKTTPHFAGVCERCGSQFTSALKDRAQAEAEISSAIDTHKCLPLDSSQNALRVVKEATENE